MEEAEQASKEDYPSYGKEGFGAWKEVIPVRAGQFVMANKIKQAVLAGEIVLSPNQVQAISAVYA